MRIHAAAQIFPLLDEAALGELAEDIHANGLRHPIVLFGEELLDGRNRLAACERAGVEPRFETYGGDDPIGYVVSANLKRRHLDYSQRAMVGRRIATLPRGSNQHTEISAPSQAQVAEMVGISVDSLQFAGKVLASAIPEVIAAVDAGDLAVSAAAELAELPKDEQLDVIERVKVRPEPNSKRRREKRGIRGGQVRAFVKQAKKAAVARKIEAEPPAMLKGPFRVIVADPPWPYEKRAGDPTHRGDLPYPPMSIDAICALGVGRLAHPEGAILWLWTTNAFMRDAFRVLDAWGFAEKTILTWVKDRLGLGDWLRGQTEHAILAIRGKPMVTLFNQSTVLHGPLREHSRKPDEFYALVEALCPGSKVEMFCRTPRPGWARWGAETERFDVAG